MERDVREVMNDRLEQQQEMRERKLLEEQEFFNTKLPNEIRQSVERGISLLRQARTEFAQAGMVKAERDATRQILSLISEVVREYRRKHATVRAFLKAKDEMERAGIISPQLLDLYAR